MWRWLRRALKRCRRKRVRPQRARSNSDRQLRIARGARLVLAEAVEAVGLRLKCRVVATGEEVLILTSMAEDPDRATALYHELNQLSMTRGMRWENGDAFDPDELL